MKDTVPTIVARIEQKLNDFILTNEKEHQDIKGSIADLLLSCNHAHEDMTKRIADLEKCQIERNAIKTHSEKKTTLFQGKLREYASIVAITVGISTLILNLPKILELIK